MKKIGITAALSMLIAGLWMAGCGGTPNCDAYSKAVDDCCTKAKTDSDKAICDTQKAAAKAATDLAGQLGTDCGTSTYTCPFM